MVNPVEIVNITVIACTGWVNMYNPVRFIANVTDFLSMILFSNL